VDGPGIIATSELDRGTGIGTSGIISFKGSWKVEIGESTISFELETSTQETDVGIGAELLILLDEDLVLRRLVDIRRHSLPRDRLRVGLNAPFSLFPCCASSCPVAG
jgi:hypothetical protein